MIGNTAADYPSRLTQYVWTIHREYHGGSEFPDEHQASGIKKSIGEKHPDAFFLRCCIIIFDNLIVYIPHRGYFCSIPGTSLHHHFDK